MKLVLQFLLLTTTVLASPGVSAVNSQEELQFATAKAQAFLCNRGFCTKQIPPVDLVEVNGYLGYVDGNYSRISISPSLNDTDTQLALVHELTHVFRGQRAPHEEQWLNEGLAKFMEYKYSTVWPVSYMTRLQQERNLNFADYRPNGGGYMSSFLLMLYLYNHFGEEKLFAKLMHSEDTGWKNVVSAIQELIAEGHLKMPLELVSKEAILRHFAVALWMNDRFAAKYALFYLDARYEGLKEKSTKSNSPAPMTLPGMQIQFTNHYRPVPIYETYALLSYTPFEIKSAEASDPAHIFISISH